MIYVYVKIGNLNLLWPMSMSTMGSSDIEEVTDEGSEKSEFFGRWMDSGVLITGCPSYLQIRKI